MLNYSKVTNNKILPICLTDSFTFNRSFKFKLPFTTNKKKDNTIKLNRKFRQAPNISETSKEKSQSQKQPHSI